MKKLRLVVALLSFSFITYAQSTIYYLSGANEYFENARTKLDSRDYQGAIYPEVISTRK
ncbi:MAG: hypothetical protein ACI86H_002350 [bacterium]|jgi:hypothetical protein